MNKRNLVLVGILVIAGGAAFVYLDPLELDLLGLKKDTVAAKPAPPHVATQVKQPAKAPGSPVQAQAPIAPPAAKPVAAAPAVPAAQPPAAAPKTAPVPSPAPAVTSASTAATTVPAAEPAVAAPGQPMQPPLKLSKSIKAEKSPPPEKPIRPKDQDLRHCLELETDAAIAKCAGE
jgi:hypothetical protein